MYELCQNRKYEKIANRPTRAGDGYIFYLTIPRMGVYNKYVDLTAGKHKELEH